MKLLCFFALGTLTLSACGGGGDSSLHITNEQLLPGIGRIESIGQMQLASHQEGATRLFINDEEGTLHESWVSEIVQRLHPRDGVLITDYDKGSGTEFKNQELDNYFNQQSDTITILPRTIDSTPYSLIVRLNKREDMNAGLLVASAGNFGISFTRGKNGSSIGGFETYLEKKRTIIAVGIDEEGEVHPRSNYCEPDYKQYCVGASYEFSTSDGRQIIGGTSFSAPIIGVAAAIMKDQFDLDVEETFEITTECASKNPPPPPPPLPPPPEGEEHPPSSRDMIVGNINLDCMFTPEGELYADKNAFRQDGDIPVTLASATLPSTPGRTSFKFESVYDEFGRDFGSLTMEREASFEGAGLPSIDFAKANRVMTLSKADLFVLEHDERPLVGLAFANGISIDGSVGDTFFGVADQVYEETKSLRVGVQQDIAVSSDMIVGIRFHYLRQHASGDSFFKNVSGHGADGEAFANISLPVGRVEASLRHDVFLGGEYEFLGHDGKISRASSSSVMLGYGVDF